MKTTTLYEDAKSAGLPMASHESDLYLPDTAEAREILARHPLQKSNATRFRSQIDGKTWIDIPFAYLPFWEAKARQPLDLARVNG